MKQGNGYFESEVGEGLFEINEIEKGVLSFESEIREGILCKPAMIRATPGNAWHDPGDAWHDPDIAYQVLTLSKQCMAMFGIIIAMLCNSWQCME